MRKRSGSFLTCYKVYSHLRFIRRDLLRERFSLHNRKKMGTQPIIELFSSIIELFSSLKR